VSPQGTVGDVTTDGWLLARIGKKDEEALSALYDRYNRLVFSMAKRILGDTGKAEEILDDLFYQVWQTAGRFDPAKGSLAGWLLVTARNRAISRLRGRSGASEELDENGVTLRLDVESRAAQNSLVNKVRTVMEGLPDEQRTALECAYFEGMPDTAIAEKTGQPLETVKTRMRSAMESLKKVLT